MPYIVVIGNMRSAYGPFEHADEAKTWAETAQYTGITDAGRASTQVVDLRAATPFAFKVEVWDPDEIDGGVWNVVVMGASFEEAEENAISKVRQDHNVSEDIKLNASARIRQ